MPGAVTAGSFVINMSANIAGLKTNLADATNSVKASSQNIVNAWAGVTAETDKATFAGARIVATLRDEIATFGMTNAELTQHRANLSGVGTEAQSLIARLQGMRAAEDAFRTSVADASSGMSAHGTEAAKAAGHVEGFSFATAGAKRELLVLAHELSQGNYSRFGGSLMVLGERTGAVSLLFSAAGIAALSLAAAVGVLGYALIKGASEQRLMNNALIMTGNYAGQTSDSLNAMAHAAAASGGSLSDAKKAVTELAASGKFTGDQIAHVSDAVVSLEHATGTSIEKTIEQFKTLSVESTGHMARASDSISRAALKLDDEYHFLTLAVYDQIRAFEKEGDIKAASARAIDTLAKVTKDRSEEMIANLGYVAKAWISVKSGISDAIDAVGNWGKAATLKDNLAAAQAELANNENRVRVGREGLALDAAHVEILKRVESAQLALNKESLRTIDQGAATVAMSNGLHAAQRVDAMLLMAQKKSQSELTTALQEYHAELAKIKAVNPNDARVTADAIAAGDAAITKVHTARNVAAAKGNDDRAKLLQDALVIEATAFDREKSIYADRDKMLSLYHSKFGLSSADFYAGEEARRAEYIKDEATEFTQEAALISGYKTRNPEEVAAKKKMYDALLRQHREFADKMAQARTEDSVNELADTKKLYDDTIKAIESAGNAEIKKLDDAIAKQREHNAEIGKTKQQIDIAKQAVEDLDTAQVVSDADFIRDAIDKAGFDDAAKAAYQIRLDFLDREIKGRKELSGLLSDASVLDAADAGAKKAEKAWDKADKAIGDGLYSAIANGGDSAVKKLIKDMKEWFARLVLSPIISPIAAFGASLINPNAASAQGTAGGVMGGVSTLSGVSNMYSAGQSIWNGFAGGMSSSIGGVIASTGSALGLSAVSAFGSGMGMSMASAGAATAAGAVSAGVGITGTAAAATTAGAAIGAAIPYVAVALAIAKVLQLGFGHGARETTSQGIEGSFGGDGFTGTQFRNWKEKGGWFSSDIKGKQTPQLDAATQEQFSSGFATLKSVSSDFAKSLGLDAGSIANYSQQISLTLTSDATANQAAITKLFSDMGDTMATQLAPNLADFAKSGETSSATLQRLATSLSAANGMFDTLGQKLYATSLAGGDMASKLVDLFGGLTNMQTVSAAYFGSFYSEQEKVDIATRQLTKNFADLGFAMPANNAALRAQIDALDLTTDAGRKSYVQLMGLSGAFASLTSATAQLAASSTAAAEAAAQAATQAAAAALDGLKSSASSAMAVLSKSVDAEKSGVKSALDAQLAIITAQQSAANAALQIETDKNAKIAALANALKSTLDGMQISGTQAADRASAQAQISQALSVAKLTGALPDSTTLTDALKTVAQPSENLFASFQDYARDYYKTSGAIGDLNTIAGKALTKSNSAISLAQDQLAALNNAATQAQTFYDRQIAQFDATLANAQAQLDVATGTNTAILSLTDAVKAFAASVAAATAATAAGQAAGQIASKPATTGDISGLYGSVLGRAPDAPGMAYWTDKAAGGASVAQIATGFYDSAEYKLDNLYSSVLGRAPDAAGMAFWTDRLNSGESIADVTGGFYNSDEYKRLNGSHANGLDSVPFDGYRAELHRGEMVLPAHVAQSVRGGSGNNDLTRELLAEIRKLRADLQAQNLAIAQNSRETAKLMRKWDGDGMPSTRTVTA